ncbi:MAG: thioredoxin family protein [Verrucomicrobia bacterium]|nr:thioredoxin family protein [Verrucomicrobiota bacterium]
MRNLVVTALISTVCLTACGELVTGGTAPGFTLTDTHGNTHSLSDFEGKFVVLEWINHGCPFVVKHYSSGNMQSLQKKYTSKDEVVWLSICSSAPGKQGHYSPDEWNALIEQKGASPTAVLIDESGEVGNLYGAKTTPHIFIIDPQGKLIYQGAIDSIRSTDTDDIPKADNFVAQALDAALMGQPIVNHTTQPYGCSVKYAN